MLLHSVADELTNLVDALAGVQACLCSISEVTEDLEGVSGAALVGVNPVFSCREPHAVSALCKLKAYSILCTTIP